MDEEDQELIASTADLDLEIANQDTGSAPISAPPATPRARWSRQV
jgi:hypothetical protein